MSDQFAYLNSAAWRKLQWWHLLLPVALLRLGLIFLLPEQYWSADAEQYLGAGMHWLKTGVPDPYWPPALPGAIAFVREIAIDGRWAGRLVAWLFWLGMVLGSVHLLGQQAGKLGRIVAVLVLGWLYPEWWLHGWEPLSQAPVACLLVWALVVGQGNTAMRWSRIVLLGFLLGLAVLFRPAVAVVAVGWPLWLMWKMRCARFSVSIGLALTILFGVSLLLSHTHERTILLNDANARNLYLGNNAWTHPYRTWELGSHWSMSPDNPEGFRRELSAIENLAPEDRAPAYHQAIRQEISEHPNRFLYRTFSRLRTIWVFDTGLGAATVQHGHKWLAGFILLFSALLWTSLLIMTGRSYSISLSETQLMTRQSWTVFLLLFIFPYLLSFSHPTYHLPLMPLLLGLAVLEPGKVAVRTRRWVVFVLIVLLLQIEWVIQMWPANL